MDRKSQLRMQCLLQLDYQGSMSPQGTPERVACLEMDTDTLLYNYGAPVIPQDTTFSRGT